MPTLRPDWPHRPAYLSVRRNLRSSPALVWTCCLTLLVATPGVPAAETSAVSQGDVGRKAGEALDTATQYTDQERTRVERKIQAELDEVEAGIQRLQTRMDQMSGETRKRAEASLADLERRKEEARRKLEEIKLAGAAVWDRMRAGLESSMDELRRLYQRVVPSR